MLRHTKQFKWCCDFHFSAIIETLSAMVSVQSKLKRKMNRWNSIGIRTTQNDFRFSSYILSSIWHGRRLHQWNHDSKHWNREVKLLKSGVSPNRNGNHTLILPHTHTHTHTKIHCHCDIKMEPTVQTFIDIQSNNNNYYYKYCHCQSVFQLKAF